MELEDIIERNQEDASLSRQTKALENALQLLWAYVKPYINSEQSEQMLASLKSEVDGIRSDLEAVTDDNPELRLLEQPLAELNPVDRQVMQQTLNSFQAVLNWCDQIEANDARLPLDLLDRSHKAINAATVRFQPDKVAAAKASQWQDGAPMPEMSFILEKLRTLAAVSGSLEPVETAEEFCEDCRIEGRAAGNRTYARVRQYVCATEHLNLAIAYLYKALELETVSFSE